MSDHKSGFWSKIKTSYSTPSFLSSVEKDGESETDTVVHNSLVKYYMNKDGRLPVWLGVETPMNYGNYNGSNGKLRNPQPMRADTVQRSASMLQDVYSKRSPQRRGPGGVGSNASSPGLRAQGSGLPPPSSPGAPFAQRPGTAPPLDRSGGVDTIRSRLKRVNF